MQRPNSPPRCWLLGLLAAPAAAHVTIDPPQAVAGSYSPRGFPRAAWLRRGRDAAPGRHPAGGRGDGAAHAEAGLDPAHPRGAAGDADSTTAMAAR